MQSGGNIWLCTERFKLLTRDSVIIVRTSSLNFHADRCALFYFLDPDSNDNYVTGMRNCLQ